MPALAAFFQKRGRAAAAVFTAAFLLTAAAGAAQASLLMGERAKSPPGNLSAALHLYQTGASHESVWRRTGWHCHKRRRGGCRWEAPRGCVDAKFVNLIRLRQAAPQNGEVALWEVFNAGCVWTQYPKIRGGVRVRSGRCGGALGLASHNGRVCINIDRIQQYAGDEWRRAVHSVLLHEIQHQIQFIEGWPRFNSDCPYQRRRLEREAFHIQARAAWSERKRRRTPPNWMRADLC